MQAEGPAVTSECGWDQNALLFAPTGRECSREVDQMDNAPSTIGIILAFLAVFVSCILWATRGHPSNADNEDLGVVAKDH
jgi:hypothetical protein